MVRIASNIEPTYATTTPVRSTGIERGPYGFQSGEVLSVELVKSVGDDEGLFRIAGRFFRALYPAELTPGVAVPMKVIDPGPPLILRLPDRLADVFAKLVHPSQIPLSEASNSLAGMLKGGGLAPEAQNLLARVLDTLNLPSDPRELAGALERLFQKSGVFHEALLSRGIDPDDVKANLLRLIALISEDDKAAPLLKALLSHVETYQARSLQNEHPVFPFVLNWGGDPLKGEIELLKEEEGKDGEKAGGLVVKLDLPNLGHVQTALWWYGGGLSVTMRVPRQVEGWLTERIGELEEKLKNLDTLRLTTLRVEPQEPPRPMRGRSLLEIKV